MDYLVLLPVIIPLAAVPIAGLTGLRYPRAAGFIAALAALLAFSAGWLVWQAGGGIFNVAWIPAWGLRWFFRLDGLAAEYILIAAGIGALVLLYSAAYIPHHLHKHHRPVYQSAGFFILMLLFIAAMAGIALAQDMIVFFLFWDLTTLTSYMLIGYDSDRKDARRAALMALLVTGSASLLYLTGVIMLYAQVGSVALPEIIALYQPSPAGQLALALIAVSALAKSAQFPFHFWLPRAMQAPTPVSAFLHSAAMVAAGILLLSKVYPLLSQHPLLLDLLLVVGLLSMALGSLLALTEMVLKRVLAYSTIAQYGYMVFLLGIGGEHAVKAVSFYLLAHALIKSALFLSAGALIEATEQDRLDRVRGMHRVLPLLSVSTAAAAAALAGLPLTIGYFKDELFLAAAWERSPGLAAVATLSAALTLAYIARYWLKIFTGPSPAETHRISRLLVLPVSALAAAIVFGGIQPDFFAPLLSAASRQMLPDVLTPYHLSYEIRAVTGLSLAAYLTGTLLALTRRFWSGALSRLTGLGQRIGPLQLYQWSVRSAARLSGFFYRMEVLDLGNVLVAILASGVLLISAGFFLIPLQIENEVFAIAPSDYPLLFSLLLFAVSGLLMVLPKAHIPQVLVLSIMTFVLVTVFAFAGAPDVALVAALIGTVSSLLFFAALMQFSKQSLQEIHQTPEPRSREVRDALASSIIGLFVFIFSLTVLKPTVLFESVTFQQAILAKEAHAKDIVTVILSDFRMLDTMGEITVIAIVLLGITAFIYWEQKS